MEGNTTTEDIIMMILRRFSLTINMTSGYRYDWTPYYYILNNNIISIIYITIIQGIASYNDIRYIIIINSALPSGSE